jgi:hypothetical protein
MYCTVCQFKTDKKWKGKPIHQMVVDKANSIRHEFKTLRKAYVFLEKDFKKKRGLKKFSDSANGKFEYQKWVKEYFKVES